jgi:hypothetical protein
MTEPIKLPPFTEEQMQALVKECGLDWRRGYMPLFDGDPTNRYAVLIEAAVEQNTADLRAEVERLREDAERFRSVVQSVALTELHKVLSGDKCVCTRCELALEARAALRAALKEPK